MTAAQFLGQDGTDGGRLLNGADGRIRDGLPMSETPTTHVMIENRETIGTTTVPDCGY
ncbi:hypothetical protein [Halanaeroarchaeum sulfurireducens]|uniref:Alcohol dehydrogenase zinc-binding domain protein n=1 Tax=Halanaeroarchaeum sulfurireducens TaxID=1604004 RepID=A0A0F7PB21_9EURY|nr:hypothetical protein [Halanaeroarchaeum sulfurireducens]AKH98356.1 alcohol dehydrogenase zinc-binding domain protein [Halanaeroarchaeum sulfurireducens]ALG82750.1 alcohol dehydrogenase zinc-binding domain protein [Halanaeroarchaeum sulfurireducens]